MAPMDCARYHASEPGILCPKGSPGHNRVDLDGEFRAGMGEARGRQAHGLGARFEGVQRVRQRGLGLGQAFTAAGAHTELAGEIAQAARSAPDRGPDVPVGNRFADANDHGAYCERECE